MVLAAYVPEKAAHVRGGSGGGFVVACVVCISPLIEKMAVYCGPSVSTLPPSDR